MKKEGGGGGGGRYGERGVGSAPNTLTWKCHTDMVRLFTCHQYKCL